MKTTLRKLKKIFNFNSNKLISNLGINNLDNKIYIIQILKSNGIKDAVKALQTQKYKDYCLFNADVAESVLHLFEEEFPNDKRPRKAIEGIRLYHAGKITKYELNKLRKNASYNTAFAGYGLAAYNASRAVVWAADFTCVFNYTTFCAADAAYFCDAACSGYEKWKEIEKLFIKHFDNSHLLDDDLFVI